MRWVPFAILAYLVIVLQCSLGQMLTFEISAIGSVGPDLAAVAALFIALHARRAADALLAAWVLGFALDLSSASGPGGVTVVGPMALAYVLAAGAVYKIREALFAERVLTRAVVGVIFCLLAHLPWVTLQTILAHNVMTWQAYGARLLQAMAISAYTGVVTPVFYPLLDRVRKWLISVPAERPGRRR
ncbi:MAG TPA: hypothetical protein PK082_10270 [Phycisphaerae bacterium]|mgnify:CR=1 FL=1|nr:hypothetical protein [Phycisphaerae bacterium]